MPAHLPGKDTIDAYLKNCDATYTGLMAAKEAVTKKESLGYKLLRVSVHVWRKMF